jgi:serine/threonine protein kinase
VFPGKDRIHQLDVILEIVGTPADEDVVKVGSQAAQKYIRRKPKSKGVDFSTYFTAPDGKSLTPDCLNLLKRMLEFSPDKRITVHEALNHPYFVDLHDPQDEAECMPKKFHFYDGELTEITQVKKLIYQEIQYIQKRNQEKELHALKQLPSTHSVHFTDNIPESSSQEATGRKESFAAKGSPYLKNDANSWRTGFLSGSARDDSDEEGDWNQDSGDGDDRRMS